MELEGSLSSSHGTAPYPDLDEFSHHPQTIFLADSF
jgi:hypothetical protein